MPGSTMVFPFPKRMRDSALVEGSVSGFSRAVDAALAFVFPATCAVCQSQGSFLHEDCESALPRLEMPFCSICARPGSAPICSRCEVEPPSYERIRAPYLMAGPVREMVYGLKYRNLRASVPELGRLLAIYLDSRPLPADLAVPVPLHKSRERERGYNQSVLLAREVSKHTGIPVGEDLLRRTRDTAPQVSLASPEERGRNIEGAFECAADVAGLRVLLVDDVVTTGSTMSACAAPLMEAEAAAVRGLALARQA